MDLFWKSNPGKLVIGGCGTQLGMLLSLVSLAITLLFCGLCVLVNGLSIGLTQALAGVSATPPVEAASSPAEVTLLREKVNLLVEKVVSIRASVPVMPTPVLVTPPPLPKPIAIANEGAANLRSGPGEHYNRVGRLPLGEYLEIVGRNSDSTWWLVTTPDGLFAWVSDIAVVTFNVDESIPVVTIPALLVYPAAGGSPGAASSPVNSTPAVSASTSPQPAAVLSPGTPTATASQSRRFVQDTRGYQQLVRHLLLPSVSESFSPGGDQIAMTEKIKLYTITPDGSSSRVLVEDGETIDLIGGAVWSPDGKYIAFVADRTQAGEPCRVVGLVRLSDGTITYLEPPSGLGLDLPRWTQDGQVLVTARAGEVDPGTVYIYDISGRGQVAAAGSYILSSSHDGQKWFPWQPGKTWQVGNAEGAESYYSD